MDLRRLFGKPRKEDRASGKRTKKNCPAPMKQIEAAIARANRTDKGKSALDSILL